jgi:hypothetical protein
MNINNHYVKRWINHEITSSDNQLRYIFCGLNEKMLINLHNSFSTEDVSSFLENRFFLLLKNDAPRIKYNSKSEAIWINTEDLLEARNKKIDDNDIRFLVFIPNDSSGASNDSLDTTSIIIKESDRNYVNYIIDNAFIKEYDFESPLLLTKISDFYFKNFNAATDYFFSKEVDSNSILDFFGIIGERKHFDDKIALKSTIYFKGFIERIKFFLYEQGFSGLLNRLISKGVKNAEITIEYFKAEKDSNNILYEQAKDFLSEIELVFLRNTSLYKSIINVDEWIEALKDEEINDTIYFEDKETEISFGIVDIKNTTNDDAFEKYLLQREELICSLNSKMTATWNDLNTIYNTVANEFSVESKNSLNVITAKILDDKISTTLVNYTTIIPDENILDFGLSILYSNDKNSLNSKIKRTSKTKVGELDIASIFDEILDPIQSINFSREYNDDILECFKPNENIQFLSLSDKELKSGSALEFILRTVDKDTYIKYLGYQDKEGDFIFSFDDKIDVNIKRKQTSFDSSIVDNKFILNNLNEGHLYILLRNDLRKTHKWIFLEIHTEGVKKELWVPNYFSYLQAKNDSKVSVFNIQILKRQNNVIHKYYFSNDFLSLSYLPSIFLLHEKSKLISTVEELPVFSIAKLELQSDFRPDIIEFNLLLQSPIFSEYLMHRKNLLLKFQKELQKTNINSFDEIEIDKIISYQEVSEYLSIYHQLLNDFEQMIWLDMFYIMEKHERYDRLDDRPLAIFFSPLHPLFIFQYFQKAHLLGQTLNEHPANSLASIIKLNDFNNWVIFKKEIIPVHYNSIETDSLLFTGYINFGQYSSGSNNLSKILKNIGVNFNPNIGHLSPSQIRSALNKSYTYLSNKTVFNIKLVGQLTDVSTNTTILNWINEKTVEMLELYDNFRLQVNIFDDRNESSFPDSNLIIYYREELNLNFNWFKGSPKDREFDVTLITSRHKDLQGYNQVDESNLAGTLNYSEIVKYSLNKYNSSKVYSDLYFESFSRVPDFVNLNKTITENFKKALHYNQIEANLSFSNIETEVLAISSDVLNAQLLQKMSNKSLWEFSISDYSFDDQGRGDYFLLAKEQDIYSLKLKKFLISIDPKMNNRVDEFLTFSKETGLFELKYLISNDNFLKGFIASVISYKLMNCYINNVNPQQCDARKYKVLTSYDVFKERIHQIKKEINPRFKEFGTQFPDFIFLEFGIENGKGVINLRLIEIKYRTDIIREEGPNSISEILNDQTLYSKKLFKKLNDFRESTEDKGLWNHTLSLLLLEFVYYFQENSSFMQKGLIEEFNYILNSDYELRLNDSLLIGIDGTPNISSGKVLNAGIFFKVPKNRINEVFECESSLNQKFIKLFEELKINDTSESFREEKNFDDTKKDFVSDEIFNGNNQNTEINPVEGPIVEYNIDAEEKAVYDISNKEVKIENKIDESNEIELTSMGATNSTEVNEVVLGKDNLNRKAIYFPLGRPGGSPLPNYNIMVTGSSGKGKTQFIKSFIYQQAVIGTSYTIIDFKNDYSDNIFCEMSNAVKIEVKFDGIPYNPLIPRMGLRDNGQKFFDVSEHINSICAVLSNTFGLGVQQEADLKKAVRQVYKSQGINPQGILEYDDEIIFPSFNDVGIFLQSGDRELDKLYNRLDPLFDLNLFRDKYNSIGFEDVIKKSNIIKLSDIQNDKIKNAIAKMIIVSAHGYYLSLPHSYSLKKLFIFDEAHRILDTEFVEKFIRECRSFGVGVLLSSQQPDDFPENVLGQLATKVIHGNDGDARLIKKIKSLLSFTGEDRVIQELSTFNAIVNSQDYQNWIIDTLAWPQLLILLIIKDNPKGLSLGEIHDYGLSVGINKDWELYVTMLIDKKYIVELNSLYFIKQ